jgi:replicative DNA helicase
MQQRDCQAAVEREYPSFNDEEPPPPDEEQGEEPASNWTPPRLADTWPRVLAELERRADGSYKPVSTGLPSLDSLLCGGLPRGATAILTAPPGFGKSSYALALCLDLARAGVPTIFWSLELTVEDAHARLVCLEKQLPWAEVRIGKHLEATREAAASMASLPMCLLDHNQLTLELLPSAIRRLAEACDVAPLIVVDYAQLLADPATDRDARVAAERVAKELLDLAKHTGAAMLLLSSVARSAYSRKGDNPEEYRGMAKESGRWESDAAVELSIVPTGEQGPRDKRGWFMLAKNRLGGPCGKVPVKYDGMAGRWEEVAEGVAAADNTPQQQAQILEAVGNHPGCSLNSIKAMVHGRGPELGKLIKNMVRAGELVLEVKKSGHQYSLPGGSGSHES